MLKITIDIHIVVNELIESNVLNINGKNRKKLDNEQLLLSYIWSEKFEQVHLTINIIRNENPSIRDQLLFFVCFFSLFSNYGSKHVIWFLPK